MTVTVRPPTQPLAEPLITVELSYIINVSGALGRDPGYAPARAVKGLSDGEVVCLDGRLNR